MPQKTLGYVELEWTCPNCGGKNPGPQKTCTACGAPQPANVQFGQKAQAELITEGKAVEAAKKGPDIHCPYCGARNPAGTAACSQCGGDLKGGERRVAGQVIGAYTAQAGPVQQVPCPNCGTPNPANSPACARCGAALAAPVAAPRPAAPPAAAPASVPRKSRLPLIIGGVVGVLLIACVIFAIVAATKRESLVGQVSQISWERSIAVEELREVTRQNWLKDIPASAEVGACEKKFYGNQAEPSNEEGAVSEEVCGTSYTKDTGSGYGEVVQDCEYRVSLDYCSYTDQEWQVVDQLALSGSDLNPHWPVANLSGSQRPGEQEEVYTIEFATDKGPYTFTTSDQQLYAQCQPGSEWTLTINAFNKVVSIEPK